MTGVRGKRYILVMLLLVATITTVYRAPSAYAAGITNRSLLLIAGGTDGGSKPGGVVNHKFTFNVPSAGSPNMGSIKFEYCTTATVVACVAPTGMSASAATFGNETGSAVTGFGMGTKTANSFILTRTAAAVAPNALVSVQANSITNPTTANYTFFVRITTYVSTNATTGLTDLGTVAASTANPIVLQGVMPESLVFCTGQTVTVDCVTVTNPTIDFNQLFSPTDTATATSEMAASTNAGTGYVITVNGTTLTSGANTIPGMAGVARTRGKSEFGMNLKLNTTAATTVAVGAEVSPTPNGTDLRGQARSGYNTVDSFKFVSGDPVAASDNTVAGPTNAQKFTVAYIVDVAGNQLAGTYTTTLTYICTPTF